MFEDYMGLRGMVKGLSGMAGVLLAIMLLCGCKGNDFRVKFDLEGGNDTYVLVYYASDSRNGWVLERPVSLSGGKGELKLQTRNPALVYVYDGARREVCVLYAERGDRITVKGGADAWLWETGGNRINEELSAWRRSHPEAGKGPGELRNKAVAEYVEGHREAPLSALLLEVYYDRSLNPGGYSLLESRLGGEAKSGRWGELSGRADMLSGHEGEDAPLRELVLNTLGSGCDTVHIGGGVPVVLCFLRNSTEGYDDYIKWLRKEVGERRDSASAVIAEVSFEPDSASRQYKARYDSLGGVVRGWMPLGAADPQAMALGVRSVPWVLKYDASGKRVYSGRAPK